MASFIQNVLWDSVSGFVEAGTRTVGGYAGDALIKAGDMVEGGGRSVGNSIERRATGLGSSISGQTYSPSAKALPSTARRPVAHRSNSLPANAKPGSGVPLGAKKIPGAGAAKKQLGNGVGKTAGGAVGGAKSTVGGVTSGVQRGVGGLSKPVGGVVNSTTNGMSKPIGGIVNNAKNTANTPASRNLPKPYPQTNSSLPKPYPQSGPNLPKPYSSTTSYPGTEKKTAVRPGQNKPFTPPKEDSGKKPYPGTNTLPGQGSKTPVKRYKPAQRYEPPAKKGEVKHLAV